jgi:hypothetical protein
VRENLARSYNMEDFTTPVAGEAETASLLRVIRSTPGGELRPLAEILGDRGKLGPFFLLRALDEGFLAFFEAGLAVRARITVDDLRRLVRLGGEVAVAKLCDKAEIPTALKDDFARAIQNAFPASDEQPQAAAQ